MSSKVTDFPKKDIIPRSKTEEEILMDEKDKYILISRYFKPYVVKLLLHMILIFLSIRAYISFKSSSEAYENFVKTLNEKVITDVKIIDYSSSCSDGYSDINFSIFPPISPGCRCNFQIFSTEACKQLPIYGKTQEIKMAGENCILMDLQMKKNNPSQRPPGRLLQNNQNNSVNYYFNMTTYLPKKCDCFEQFNGVPANKTIDRFFQNKRICIKKEKSISTLDYLKSIEIENCPNNLRCQHYFCAKNFASQQCPIIDIFPTKVKQNANSSNYELNKDNSEIILSTINRDFFDNTTFQNEIILPILNMRIVRNGKCSTQDDSNLFLDYYAIKNIECPFDQQVSDFYSTDLKTILNYNDNYYDMIANKLPLFDVIVNQEVKWSLGIEYAFHRKTIACLFNKYDQLNSNGLFANVTRSEYETIFNVKKKQMKNLLLVFIFFKDNYDFQEKIQLSILIINSVVVFFNLFIIFYKILLFCVICPQCLTKFINKEHIVSFLLDLSIAILGGVSYFIIGKFSDYLDAVISANCLDNYTQYQFGIFNDSLQSTMDQNLQIFVFIIFKIFLIIMFLGFYLIHRRCSFRCRTFLNVLEDNIKESEGELDINELKNLMHESNEKSAVRSVISKYLNEIKKKNSNNEIIDHSNFENLDEKKIELKQEGNKEIQKENEKENKDMKVLIINK